MQHSLGCVGNLISCCCCCCCCFLTILIWIEDPTGIQTTFRFSFPLGMVHFHILSASLDAFRVSIILGFQVVFSILHKICPMFSMFFLHVFFHVSFPCFLPCSFFPKVCFFRSFSHVSAAICRLPPVFVFFLPIILRTFSSRLGDNAALGCQGIAATGPQRPVPEVSTEWARMGWAEWQLLGGWAPRTWIRG